MAGFFADTQKIAEDLRTKPVTPDELERAKQPRIESVQKAQLTNGYWLGELSGAAADPRRLDVIRDLVPGTQRVTAADVMAAAQQWLKPETAYKIEVLPQSYVAAQGAAKSGG
jgi:zinc protease